MNARAIGLSQDGVCGNLVWKIHTPFQRLKTRLASERTEYWMVEPDHVMVVLLESLLQ